MTEYVLTPGIHWIEALKATLDISRNGTVWVRTDEEIEPVKLDESRFVDPPFIGGGTITWIDDVDELAPRHPWLARFAKWLLRLAR